MNAEKRQQAVSVLDRLLREAMTQGWYGRVNLEVTIQDGRITTIKSGPERHDK